MKEIKIGDKIISIERARGLIEKIFELRSGGSTQEEVAGMLGLERSFISRLEGIGEIRRTKEIGLIGSGVRQAGKVEAQAKALGIEFIYLTDHAKTSLPEVLSVLNQAKELDYVVFLGSEEQRALIEKILDKKVVGIPLEKELALEEILKELSDKRTRRSFRSTRRGEKGERGRKRESWLVTPESRS